MKILAVSDTHGNLDGLDLSGVDVVFFAGDVAPLKGRGPWHVYDQIKWMNRVFADWCSRGPSCRIVVVPGNHDFYPIAGDRFGIQLKGKDLSIRLPENVTTLIDQEAEIKTENGAALRVYGTPWVPVISYSWAFEAEHDRLTETFSRIPASLDVLVAHTPPRFGTMDVSLQIGPDGERFGSSELTRAVAEKKPKMLFCGHIHSGDHAENDVFGTRVWNVSRSDELYKPTYDPLILEI